MFQVNHTLMINFEILNYMKTMKQNSHNVQCFKIKEFDSLINHFERYERNSKVNDLPQL